jgi:hypothetical protein
VKLLSNDSRASRWRVAPLNVSGSDLASGQGYRDGGQGRRQRAGDCAIKRIGEPTRSRQRRLKLQTSCLANTKWALGELDDSQRLSEETMTFAFASGHVPTIVYPYQPIAATKLNFDLYDKQAHRTD